MNFYLRNGLAEAEDASFAGFPLPQGKAAFEQPSLGFSKGAVPGAKNAKPIKTWSSNQQVVLYQSPLDTLAVGLPFLLLMQIFL